MPEGAFFGQGKGGLFEPFVRGAARETAEKLRHVVERVFVRRILEHIGDVGHVVLKSQRVGADLFVAQHARTFWLPLCGQGGEHQLLERGQRGDRLFQEPVGPGSQRIAAAVAVARGGQHHADARLGLGEFGDQVDAVAIGQAEVDDHDRGAVDLQVAPRRAQAVRPSDPRAGAQAQKAHCLAGITAVFDDENGETQQGPRRGGSRDGGGERVLSIHDNFLEVCIATQSLLTVG